MVAADVPEHSYAVGRIRRQGAPAAADAGERFRPRAPYFLVFDGLLEYGDDVRAERPALCRCDFAGLPVDTIRDVSNVKGGHVVIIPSLLALCKH